MGPEFLNERIVHHIECPSAGGCRFYYRRGNPCACRQQLNL